MEDLQIEMTDQPAERDWQQLEDKINQFNSDKFFCRNACAEFRGRRKKVVWIFCNSNIFRW